MSFKFLTANEENEVHVRSQAVHSCEMLFILEYIISVLVLNPLL